MKHLHFYLSILSLLLLNSCCKQDRHEFSADLLKGGYWILQTIDGNTVVTDNIFILNYADGKETFGIRADDGKGGIAWSVSNNDYTFDGQTISLISSTKDLQSTVLALDENHLTYRVKKRVEDGVTIEDTSTYTFYRTSVDYSTAVIGMWEGRNTTPGTVFPEEARWEILNSGLFNYYKKTEDSWVMKNTNNYYVYGNIIITEYPTATDIMCCDIWNVVLTNNTMNWSAMRNGIENSVQMVKMLIHNTNAELLPSSTARTSI